MIFLPIWHRTVSVNERPPLIGPNEAASLSDIFSFSISLIVINLYILRLEHRLQFYRLFHLEFFRLIRFVFWVQGSVLARDE